MRKTFSLGLELTWLFLKNSAKRIKFWHKRFKNIFLQEIFSVITMLTLKMFWFSGDCFSFTSDCFSLLGLTVAVVLPLKRFVYHRKLDRHLR